MNKPFASYFGGKGGNGTYQSIINEIPPHDTLIIPFAGNCAITRNIKPANMTILNDIDPEVIKRWANDYIPNKDLILSNKDFRRFFSSYKFLPDNFIYCDPPYLKSSRKSNADVYNFEMSDRDHIDLLQIIIKLNCNVAISSLPNKLYDEYLHGWRKVEYKNITRRGLVIESLYCNYNIIDGALHDYNFLGKDFIDRQRIKRKINQMVLKLSKLNDKERMAIITKLNDEKF